jgi:hypothetical protein
VRSSPGGYGPSAPRLHRLLRADRHGPRPGLGDNSFGQLGDGTTRSGTPVRAHLPAGRSASALGVGPGADQALAIVHKVQHPYPAERPETAAGGGPEPLRQRLS